MKTLVITLAILSLSLTTLPAKEATFISAIISDGDGDLQISLSSHQWLKLTNFSQIPADDQNLPTAAGVAVFKGGDGLWVLFASDPRVHSPHEDLFVAGPALVVIASPKIGNPLRNGGATVFVSYQRGSD